MYLHSKNQKKFISIFIVLIFSFLFVAQGVMAGDDITIQTGAQKALSGLKTTAGTGFGTNVETLEENSDIPSIVGQIIGSVLAFVGLLLLMLLIYGGFIWMTAAGNEEKIKKAIDIIIQAVIGLIIISAAYLITQFVGETVTLPFTQK